MDSLGPAVDILCRVVDNFGDIGVVYRLARALSEAGPELRLRLVVDDLTAFGMLAPGVDPQRDVQSFRGWTVASWNPCDEDSAIRLRGVFVSPRPRLVIECFACGRPDWFEDILFDPADPETRHIVNLDYLSAEPWVDEFHRMPSLTRSPLVRKHVFMPGFTAKTGGLILDAGFARALERFRDGPGRAEARRELLSRVPVPPPAGLVGSDPVGSVHRSPDAADRFWIVIFGYERDYARIVADIAAFHATEPVLVLAAAGKSQDCLVSAWRDSGEAFPLVRLPFLAQELWDELLLASDFSIVRGEETLARAALAGRPFLWQAYVQAGRHQLVKVGAALDRMRPFFDPESFRPLESLFLAFNDREVDAPGVAGDESLLPVLAMSARGRATGHDAAADRDTHGCRGESAFRGGFAAFSRELAAHGDLAANLLTFLRELL